MFAPPSGLGRVVVYLFLSDAGFRELIDEQDAIQDVGEHGSRDWVPCLECWFPRRIPYSLIDSVLPIDIQNEATAEIEVANKPLHRIASPLRIQEIC